MDGTIVVMDYSSYERQKIKHVLEKIGNFEVVEVASIGQFRLLEINFDSLQLIILDLSFPSEAEGFEVLSSLRGSPNTGDIPIIVLSKSDKQEHKAAALQYSVSDFIIKPYQIKRLENSIRSIVRLQEGFHYDTSAMGSIVMSFDHFMSRELKLAKRTGCPLSLVLVTALRIKWEDAEVEKEETAHRYEAAFSIASEKMRSAMRATDTIVMNGMRDVIAILPCTDHEGAESVCDKIKTQIDEDVKSAQMDPDAALYPVHVSFPEDGDSFQALMESAFKKVSDKQMLEKIAQIPANQRKYANRRYNQFRKWFW